MSSTPRNVSLRAGQRGWIGLIVLLIALLIVAMLTQTLLKQSGLLSGSTASSKFDNPRSAGEAGPAPLDAGSVTPAPTRSLERARDMERQVQQQAQDMGKQIDDATK